MFTRCATEHSPRSSEALRPGATALRPRFARRHHYLRSVIWVERTSTRATTAHRRPSMRHVLCAVVFAAFVTPAYADVDPTILEAVKKVKAADYPSANAVTIISSQQVVF